MKELVVGVALRIRMVGSICGGPLHTPHVIVIHDPHHHWPPQKKTSIFRETLIPIKPIENAMPI